MFTVRQISSRPLLMDVCVMENFLCVLLSLFSHSISLLCCSSLIGLFAV